MKISPMSVVVPLALSAALALPTLAQYRQR
jgi:hypothetical protein